MTSSWIRPALALVAAATLALAGCSFEPEEKIWEISGGVFGTSYTVDLVLAEDPDKLDALAAGIETVLEQVDSSMSTWRPESELSRFNTVEDQSQWFPISRPLFEVLAAARNISELSDGAFDVTVGPVVNLWGFGPQARPETVPDEATLAAVLADVGYETLELREEPPAVRSSRRQYVDLSAIAKGYAVDAVSEYLAGEGIEAFLVEIGGEVRAHGRKPGNEPWRLAIEEPISEARQVNRIVVLENQAMATSGDYRNYYEAEGQRFSHTIDPDTGRPIGHNLASVTVIVENCALADGLATAFNVMGHERAMALATRLNLAAYFIVRGEAGFETYQTPAFSSYIVD